MIPAIFGAILMRNNNKMLNIKLKTPTITV